eukprot:jgi/Ulvmu1/10780/UM069_0014.1
MAFARTTVCNPICPSGVGSKRGAILRAASSQSLFKGDVPLAYGTMLCGEGLDRTESFAMLDHAHSLGIRTWDSAEMYPVPQAEETAGRSEEILGQWIQSRQHERSEHAIVTKVAGPGNMPWIRGGPAALDGKNILRAADGSLQRLSTDYIDCLLLHWPDRYVPMFGETDFDATMVYSATPMSEQLAALQTLLSSGKIRAWGLSNETPWGVCHATAVARSIGLHEPAMVQNAYNLLCRTADGGMMEVCHMEGVPFVGYSPLAMGLLGGGYVRDQHGMWQAPAAKRLIKYKHRYAEAESRYGPRTNVACAIDCYAKIATEALHDRQGATLSSHGAPLRSCQGTAAAVASEQPSAALDPPASRTTEPPKYVRHPLANGSATEPTAQGTLSSAVAPGNEARGASKAVGDSMVDADSAQPFMQPGLVRLAVKWALQRPGVHGLVVGARTPEQLTEVVHAATDGGVLGGAVLRQVDDVQRLWPNPCP